MLLPLLPSQSPAREFWFWFCLSRLEPEKPLDTTQALGFHYTKTVGTWSTKGNQQTHTNMQYNTQEGQHILRDQLTQAGM